MWEMMKIGANQRQSLRADIMLRVWSALFVATCLGLVAFWNASFWSQGADRYYRYVTIAVAVVFGFLWFLYRRQAIYGHRWVAMLVLAGLGWGFVLAINATTTSWTLDAGTATSLLIGVLQTEATILAIALSFSLFYAQSVFGSYSLRATQLLTKQAAYRLLLLDTLGSIFLNGLLILVVRDTPNYLPTGVTVLSVVSLCYVVLILPVYIADVAKSITPEAMVDYLLQQLRRIEHDPEKRRDSIRKGETRVLIDTASRAIQQGDLAIVREIVSGIVPWDYALSLPTPLEIREKEPEDPTMWDNPSVDQEAMEEQRAKYEKKHQQWKEKTDADEIERKKDEAALLSDCLAIFQDIWTLAVRFDTKDAGRVIVEALFQVVSNIWSHS